MNALIALGSNTGARRVTLQAALAELGRLPETRLLKTSAILKTAPEDPSRDGGPYLNAAALLHTGLGPHALMDRLLELERRFGRRRRGARPRSLDLDIILHGRSRLRTPGLTLPHPRFRRRDFVLKPAAQIAPLLRDPVSGGTLAALWRAWQAGVS